MLLNAVLIRDAVSNALRSRRLLLNVWQKTLTLDQSLEFIIVFGYWLLERSLVHLDSSKYLYRNMLGVGYGCC